MRQSFHLASNSVDSTKTFHQKAGSPINLCVKQGLINVHLSSFSLPKKNIKIATPSATLNSIESIAIMRLY